MSNINHIKKQLEASSNTIQAIIADETILSAINSAANRCVKAYQTGNKTIWAGNGGSAADAQHLAGEMVSRFMFDRDPLPAIALNANSSVVTAISNDYGYNKVFSRQITANGQKGDVFFGISTSGESPNIIDALNVCRERGIFTVGLTGNKPCAMDALCDIIIKVPSPLTPRIQESHILIGHILCEIIEAEIFSKK
ncbi:MAG: D-sedoheptulose 7-phosphate isomerase [bacterium]